MKDFADALSDSDKGFLRTVIDLSSHPGRMLRDYIYGKRQRYLSAGKYSFLFIVLFTVHLSYLESHYGWFEMAAKGINLQFSETEKDEKAKPINFKFSIFGEKIDKQVQPDKLNDFNQILISRYHKTIFDYLKFLIVLWIPIFSIFSRLIFRKSHYNLAEHITINSYLYSQILLIFLLLSPFYWIMPKMASTTFMTSSIASIAYIAFCYLRIFNKGNYRLFKTFTALSVSFFTYVSVISTAIVGLGVWVGIDYLKDL